MAFARPCGRTKCTGRTRRRACSAAFRQNLEPVRGEELIVDDILLSGRKLSDLKALLEAKGAQVVGLKVMVYQPTPVVTRLLCSHSGFAGPTQKEAVQFLVTVSFGTLHVSITRGREMPGYFPVASA